MTQIYRFDEENSTEILFPTSLTLFDHLEFGGIDRKSDVVLLSKPIFASNYTLSSATTVTEGNTLTFTITRSGSTPSETIYFSTLSGTASYPSDYTTTSGGAPANIAVSFSSGATSRTVTLNILNDGVADLGETFRAIVQRNTSDPITTYLATTSNITINDAPIASSYTLSSATTVTEGNTLTFTITRSGSTPSETIYFSTLSGTASYPSDYTTTSGGAPANIAVSFSSGATSRTVTLNILNDGVADSGETFSAIVQRNSSDPINTYLATTGNITTNDAPILTSYAISSAATVTEGNTLTFTITRSGSTPSETIYFSTLSGTASYPSDYTTTSGGAPANTAVSFSSGATSRTVTLNILNDGVADSGETFSAIVQRNGSDPINTYLATTGNITINDAAQIGDDYADELSDNSAPIGQLNVGGSATGIIQIADGNDTYGDKDVFAVNLIGGQTYRFTLTSTGLPQGIFTIRDSSFSNVLTTSAIGSSVDQTFSADQNGTYYIRVGTGGLATDQGGYRISVSLITQPAANDDFPDDPAETGTQYAVRSIGSGGSVRGTIETAGDKDIFSVTMAAGHRYQISVTSEDNAVSATALSGVYATLRDGSAFGSILRSSSGASQATITYDATSGGLEHIRVGASGSGSATGGYRVSFLDLGLTPAPVAPPPVVPQQSVYQRVGALIDSAITEIDHSNYKYLMDGEIWNSLRLVAIGMEDADAYLLCLKLKGLANKLGIAFDIASGVNQIVNSTNPGREYFAVSVDLVAGAFVSRAAFVGGGVAGTFFAGPLGGIFASAALLPFVNFVYNWRVSDNVQDWARDFYDGIASAEFSPALTFTDFSDPRSPISPSAALDPAQLITFDEAFYLQQHPEVATQISAGLSGSALAHFLAIGIDLGYQPNASQTITRADLALQISDNNPLALGSASVLSQRLGNLAGDGISAIEQQVAAAINAQRGSSPAFAIDASLTAFAHRKALDLIANGASGAAGTAIQSASSDWAAGWSNGNALSQQFIAELEQLLGAAFPTSNIRLIVSASLNNDVASIMANLLAKLDASDLSNPTFDTLGIAEFGGLWVILIADRPTAAVVSDPAADVLFLTTQFGGSGADTMLAGSRAGILNGLSGDDLLLGGASADTLNGGDGNDALSGGSGVDILFGGDGDDRLIVSPTGSGSFIDGGAGIDTLATTGTLALGSLAGIEAIELAVGSNFTLTGTQVTNGLALTTTISGTGTLTVNMDAPGNFISKLFTFVGSGVSMFINGTSGNDIIKLGNATNTVNTGDGSNIVQGGNLVDIIIGGSGIDKIAGNGNADILTGGAGADVFKYRKLTDSGLGAAADRITDFVIGSDRLNFSKIDANAGLGGDQAFAFVGSGAFSGGGAGSIRYQNSGADLLVQVDVDGNGTADMEIILEGLTGQTLSAGNFTLGLDEPGKNADDIPNVMDALDSAKSVAPSVTFTEIATAATVISQSVYYADSVADGVYGFICRHKDKEMMGPVEII